MNPSHLIDTLADTADKHRLHGDIRMSHEPRHHGVRMRAPSRLACLQSGGGTVRVSEKRPTQRGAGRSGNAADARRASPKPGHAFEARGALRASAVGAATLSDTLLPQEQKAVVRIEHCLCERVLRFLLVVATVSVFFAMPLGSSVAAIQESRVMFDEKFSWITKEGADRLIEDTKKAGFNVLVPCVWHGRGTSWPSERAPREPRWRANWVRNHDPLAYLIERAHASGIEVHPWFTVSLRQRDMLSHFVDPGTPTKSFNMHDAAFRTFIVELILEVVARYDVDGVNLDYIRTRGFCRSTPCHEEYRARYGRDLAADIRRYDDRRDVVASLHEWTRDVTTDVVRRVAEGARQLKPGIVVSVDTIVGVWREQGAAGAYWANNGWADVVFHMDYEHPLRTSTIIAGRDMFREPERFALLLGNYELEKRQGATVRSRDGALLIQHIQKARELTPDSRTTAVYQYPFLSDEQVDLLRRGPFKEPAVAVWPVRQP